MQHGKRIVSWILIVGVSLGLMACGGDEFFTPLRPDIELSADFSPVVVDVTATRTITVTNIGGADATLSNITVTGDDDTEIRLAALPDPLVVAAGTGTSIDIAISARSRGTATLSIIAIPLGSQSQAKLSVALEKRSADICDDDNPCTLDYVDAFTGECRHEDSVGVCDDGSACTTGDVCFEGRCIGEAVECDDGVDCTDDICDPALGCTAVPIHDRCDDGIACSDNVCGDAGCTYPPSADGTPCGDYEACVSVDICINQACVPVDIPDDAPCDDGDPCTDNDTCAAGTCGGIPAVFAPQLDTFASTWISPDEVTLVPGGLVSAATLGDRLTFQTAHRGSEGLSAVHTHAALSSRHAASIGYQERIGALVHVSDTRYVRVRFSREIGRVLDVIDMANIDAPVLLERVVLEHYGQTTSAIAVDGSYVYVCGYYNVGPLRFDINNLDAAPLTITSSICNVGDDDIVLTQDNVWANVDPSGAQIFKFEDGSVSGLASWGYAPDGISNYGEVEDAFISDQVLILDIGHPTKYFAHDFTDPNPSGSVIYGNAPSLSGRRIVGLVDRRVLVEKAPGVLAFGAFSADMTSFSVDEDDTLVFPFALELAQTRGWTADDVSVRILDRDDATLVVRAADGRVYMVPLDKSPAYAPLQSPPLTDWFRTDDRTGLISPHGVHVYESADALAAQATPYPVLMQTAAAFMVGATSSPAHVMSGPLRVGAWGNCSPFCGEPVSFRGESVRINIDTPVPTVVEEAGQSIFGGVALSVAASAGRGCVIAQAQNPGHFRVADICTQTSLFSDASSNGLGLVNVGRVPVVHHDHAFTMLALYGQAALFERLGEELVVTQHLQTGATGQDMTGAALSEDTWVVGASGQNASMLHFISRTTGERLGRFDMPDRDSFSASEPMTVLGLYDEQAYVAHHDASGEYVLIVGADDDAPFGFAEMARIEVPARAMRMYRVPDTGDFEILTEAGVGRLSPVCLGLPNATE